jgi:glucokinase
MLIAMYLGVEIGGTKLQLGLGRGDGELLGLWRGTVDVAAGGDGIRKQIVAAVPELLASASVRRDELQGVGVGFGGPVDDTTRSVIKSHQIGGWDGFPLADWLGEALGLPAVLGNDADVAGLAEALFGRGKGLSPVLYTTIGSGIGGGIIINGQILRGIGRGAAEIGHLKVRDPRTADGRLEPLENIASGWAIGRYARECVAADPAAGTVLVARAGSETNISALTVGEMVTVGDPLSVRVLDAALDALADAICAAIVLVCPRRVVIGGGVSLIGERHFFAPLRERIAERVFPPFAGLTDVVPAALGEAVVVQGALALAQRTLGTAVR